MGTDLHVAAAGSDHLPGPQRLHDGLFLFHSAGKDFVYDPDSGRVGKIGPPLPADQPRPQPRSAPQGGAAPTTPSGYRSLSLVVGTACNLACVYCYREDTAPSPAMTSATARTAVDLYLSGRRPGAPASIEFIGGEPLLALDVIAGVVDYCAQLNVAPVRYAVTTNGTLLTPAAVTLMAEHRFAIDISIDGDPAIHDATRRTKSGRPTHALVVRSTEHLVGAGLTVGARATWAPQQGASLVAVHQYLLSLGFSRIRVEPAYSLFTGEADFAAWDSEVRALITWMYVLVRAGEVDVLRRLSYPWSVLRKIHFGARRCLICASPPSQLAVDPAGQVFVCHRLTDTPTAALGSVHHGMTPRPTFPAEAVSSTCNDCWAKALCLRGCPTNGPGKHFGTDYAFCLSTKSRLAALLEFYVTLTGDQRQALFGDRR